MFNIDMQSIITEALKEIKYTLVNMEKEIQLDNYRKALETATTEQEYYSIKQKINRLSTFVSAGSLDIEDYIHESNKLKEIARQAYEDYQKSCIVLEFLKGIHEGKDVQQLEKGLRSKYK